MATASPNCSRFIAGCKLRASTQRKPGHGIARVSVDKPTRECPVVPPPGILASLLNSLPHDVKRLPYVFDGSHGSRGLPWVHVLDPSKPDETASHEPLEALERGNDNVGTWRFVDEGRVRADAKVDQRPAEEMSSERPSIRSSVSPAVSPSAAAVSTATDCQIWKSRLSGTPGSLARQCDGSGRRRATTDRVAPRSGPSCR